MEFSYEWEIAENGGLNTTAIVIHEYSPSFGYDVVKIVKLTNHWKVENGLMGPFLIDMDTALERYEYG